MTGQVGLETREGVAWLTLRNPSRRNALDAAMVERLVQVLATAEADPAVSVIALTGADGEFCAGADLHELAEVEGADGESGVDAAESAVVRATKPVVAVVEGNCVGAGVALMLACDVALASPTARIGVTAARIGLVYPARPTARLVERVGATTALRMLYTGERLDAAEAQRIGLVDAVHEDVAEAGRRLGAVIAANSRLAARAAKEVVNALRQGDPSRAEALAAAWQRRADDSGEFAEGLRAFAERRPPRFPWQPPSSSPVDQSGSK